MNIRTPSDHVKVVQAMAPQSHTSGSTSLDGIDCLGYESLLVVANVGAIADTANYSLTLKLQESSDDGDSDAYADITDATTGAIDNDGQNEVYLIEVNLSEVERYIKPVVTAGSSGGGLISVEYHLFEGRSLPPTQQNTVVQVEYT